MKNQLKNLFLLVFFLFVTGLSLQADEGKHFLWEVKSDSTTVYILGSVHIAKESLYPLDKVIEDAYQKSDAIAVEVDAAKANNMDLAMKVAQKATYQDWQTLEKNVSPELFARFEASFKEAGMTKEIYNKFKPWYALMVMTLTEAQTSGYINTEGIDMHFINLASEDGKPIYELETVEEQLSLFDYLDNVMNEYVEYSLNEMSNSNDKIDSMFVYWKAGDTKKMFDFTMSDLRKMDNYEAFLDLFFWKRNKKMAKVIEAYIENGTNCFVVVGSGHLLTEKGIIGLLESTKKYKIRQL